MALITAVQARQHIPGLDTNDDTLLDVYIAAMGAAFARSTGRPPATVGATPTMEGANYVRIYTGRGGRDLVFDVWPVTAVSAIEDDVNRDFDGSAGLVAADYGSGPNEEGTGVLLISTSTHGAWSSGKKQIKASFTAGYATTPDDLAMLARVAVKNAWDLRTRQGKTSGSASGNSANFTDQMFLPPLVRVGLSSFLLPRAVL